jgi:hypothetical protein
MLRRATPIDCPANGRGAHPLDPVVQVLKSTSTCGNGAKSTTDRRAKRVDVPDVGVLQYGSAAGRIPTWIHSSSERIMTASLMQAHSGLSL